MSVIEDVTAWVRRYDKQVAGKICPSGEQWLEALMARVGNGIGGQALRAEFERLDHPLEGLAEWQAAEIETAERWLTPEARDFMAKEQRRSGDREVSWVLHREDSGKFGRPFLSIRGNSGETFFTSADFGPGDLLVHSHPSDLLTPSPTDLRTIRLFLRNKHRVGFGIVNPTATRLYLVRDPHPAEEATDGMD